MDGQKGLEVLCVRPQDRNCDSKVGKAQGGGEIQKIDDQGAQASRAKKMGQVCEKAKRDELKKCWTQAGFKLSL